MIQPGTYRHYKGALYKVIGIAQHSETLEHLVVYKAVDVDKKDSTLWVRPYAMFIETITVDGKPVKRFSYVGA